MLAVDEKQIGMDNFLGSDRAFCSDPFTGSTATYNL
jgi:hypothetical protein